jgi:hypothetical protein
MRTAKITKRSEPNLRAEDARTAMLLVGPPNASAAAVGLASMN